MGEAAEPNRGRRAVAEFHDDASGNEGRRLRTRRLRRAIAHHALIDGRQRVGIEGRAELPGILAVDGNVDEERDGQRACDEQPGHLGIVTESTEVTWLTRFFTRCGTRTTCGRS